MQSVLEIKLYLLFPIAMMLGMVMLFGSRFHITPLYRVESLPSQIHQELSQQSPPSLAISYKRPTSIAICTLSKSEREWTTLHDSYVYQFFLQGVYRSTQNETEDYLITLHVGVDGDDRYWQEWGRHLIETAQLEFGLSLFLHNYNQTQRYKLPFNNLMRDAAASGADYLVRLNDDTEILSHGWIPRAIKHLLSYTPPNIGVVGPACKQDSTMRGILTHDMVHRIHLDIYENYYPERFNNWYIDDWITEVYKPKRSTILDSWTVHHHTEHGMRYRQSGSLSDLKLEVALGKSKLTKFLRKEYNFSVDQLKTLTNSISFVDTKVNKEAHQCSHILPHNISQGIKLIQLGEPRTGSTFQYRLLCAIVRLRRHDVDCRWRAHMSVSEKAFTDPKTSFVYKTHSPGKGELELLQKQNSIHVFSSGNIASYAHYNQEKDNLRNCSDCEVEKYRCLFNMTDTEIAFLQEVMKMWGILRRCCGFQMSKYERLRLHGCDVQKFINRSDYPHCELYNLTQIENQFLQLPQTHTNNREGYENCKESRAEIMQGKDFNGAPFKGCNKPLLV